MNSSRLRAARKAKGWTQKSLAEKLGLTKSAVSNWENGISTPHYEELTRLADLLEVSLDYLRGESDIQKVVKLDSDLADLEKLLTGPITFKGQTLDEEQRQRAKEMIEYILFSSKKKDDTK